MVLAQITRMAETRPAAPSVGLAGRKGPRLSPNVELPGRFCLYRPAAQGDSQVQWSKKLDRGHLQALGEALEKVLRPEDQVLIRTAAASVPPQRVIDEVLALKAAWDTRFAKISPQPEGIQRVWRDGPALRRILRNWMTKDANHIVTDDPKRAREVEALAAEWGLPPAVCAVTVLPHGRSVLTEYDLEAELSALAARQVTLRGGGSIVIDVTEALTAIDVNGGGRTALDVNLEAAREIGRQVRLRDIGGLIVIDFVDVSEPAHRDKIVKALQRALSRDGSPVRMGAFSPFGTLELARARRGAGIADAWSAPCPCCAGTGWSPSADGAGLALLRAVAGRSASTQTGPTRIGVGADLAAWFDQNRAALLTAFEDRGQVPPAVHPDPELAPLAWRLDGD